MKTELYHALKGINAENLSEENKEELLRFFVVAEDHTIRNQIAFILSDVKYNRAIPFIIEKINDKKLAHHNGSLVYALENLDVKDSFIEVVNMVCEMEYEPRYQAYEILRKYAPEISEEVREKALAILEVRRILLEITATDKGPDSALDFVEHSIELIKGQQNEGTFI
ncbi:hypothetical protein [Chitinophaga ginsengisoli]|uniref:HEAT repeat protein n=1 Tax=Chitinophaga ginsengisoli TaxID=363837 RepID=A0A2P8GAH1_9BACT|nr:hypothetical protein [Chitinophaga ginsengisoli]PSL30915.1 hypothetical protein CLV42_105276 [Chitinophaga ginsengisoli]